MAEHTTTMPPDSPPVAVAQASPSPSRKGVRRLVHDLRHRRRRFRQFIGFAFVFLVSFLGAPRLDLWWVGTALAVLGMLVRFWASGYVMKNEVLATNGPYARVRHPLYVGNILICAGFCFASGLWWSVPVALAVLLLFYPEAIRYEDQKLRRLFPSEWDAWAGKTRALWPRLTPYEGAHAAPWSFGRSLLRNGEPVHILVLGACLALLWSKLG